MLIIGNGKIVTRDPARPFIANGAVVLEGNSILEVGDASLREKYAGVGGTGGQSIPPGVNLEFIDARGGVIMPGVRLGLQALSAGTSLLPDISLTAPARVIGTNTAEAMRSGAVYATASMIDGMTDRMEAELGCACTAVATGLNAQEILKHCRREIIYDENLLLKGLWVIWQKRQKSMIRS